MNKWQSAAAKYFWEQVYKSERCWIWMGHRDPKDGYGKYTFRNPNRKHRTQNMTAHRFAYEDVRGAVPNGRQLDHICRVRLCVNPDHLDPVTEQVNKLRARRRYCKRGHDQFAKGARYVNPNNGRERCKGCLDLVNARNRKS